jgi:lipoprotein-releasing system ATP-binding protein
MTHPALELKNITQTFRQGDIDVSVLKGINISIYPGEIVALVGQSGAGKTTLLQIAGLLEHPTSGDVLMNGISCTELADAKRTELRRTYAGFVYQFHHLLPEFSALENVVLPQLIQGKNKAESIERAKDLLTRLGLEKRFHHRPKKLSGGEQQRVAIARAVANAPKILLADEPTGNLDMATSDVVFDEMLLLARGSGLGALIATHNMDLARKMDRIVYLSDGLLN